MRNSYSQIGETETKEKKEKVQIDIVDYTLKARERKLAKYKMNLLGLNKSGQRGRGRPKGSLSWRDKQYVENFLVQEKSNASVEEQPKELNENIDHTSPNASEDYFEEVLDKFIVFDPLDTSF